MYSFIIVDYGSIKTTMSYIEHCSKRIEEVGQIHFVIVDNMPNSHTLNILEECYTINLDVSKFNQMQVFTFLYKNCDVSIILTNQNIGYARGNNIGIRYAHYKWDDQYIVISNNDIEFPENVSLKRLSDILENNCKLAVVGPRVEDLNGNLQGPYNRTSAWNALIKEPFKILPNIILKNRKEKKNKKNIFSEDGIYYWVSGCFLMGSIEKLMEIECFDENTFLYAEEMILSERLLKKGYAMYYTNLVKIIHCSSKTVGEYLKNLDAEQMLFDSNYYYFKEYMNTNRIVLFIAKMQFSIIKGLFYIGQAINRKYKLIDCD